MLSKSPPLDSIHENVSDAAAQQQQALMASLYAQFGAIGPNNMREVMQEMLSMYGQTALTNEVSEKSDVQIMARAMAHNGKCNDKILFIFGEFGEPY